MDFIIIITDLYFVFVVCVCVSLVLFLTRHTWARKESLGPCDVHQRLTEDPLSAGPGALWGDVGLSPSGAWGWSQLSPNPDLLGSGLQNGPRESHKPRQE